jgi:hypothetical protein
MIITMYPMATITTLRMNTIVTLPMDTIVTLPMDTSIQPGTGKPAITVAFTTIIVIIMTRPTTKFLIHLIQ